MIILYLASLFFSLVTHKNLYAGEAGGEESGWSLSKSICDLLGATLGVAWMSDMLVGTIDTMGRTLGWTDLFYRRGDHRYRRQCGGTCFCHHYGGKG